MKLHDLKVLWGQSGCSCAICHVYLVRVKENLVNKTVVGVMAHIKGENPGSARYDQNLTGDERDGEPNRILLCPTCHTIIDDDEQSYTVEKLHKIKSEQIEFVLRELAHKVANVTFAELEAVINYLIGSPLSLSDLSVIPTKEKIARNNLSPIVDKFIKIGLMQSNQIAKYLNENVDPQFSEKLRGGFISKYMELKNQDLDSNEIFFEMLDFASNYSRDFNKQAAGLSVLSYFFELCDVFEK